MQVINHRLCQDDGTPVTFRPSPNCGGAVKHEYLVMHYTAGPSLDQAVKWLVSASSKASAHIVIGRDGKIVQLVPFDTVAWHAGVSSWQGLSKLNNYALGIELDNAGPLVRSGNQWVAWFGDIYSNDQVIEATHKNESSVRGWHLYSPQQLYLALEIAALLVHHYHLKDVLGHEDISPGRKTDPGPAFPMETFRSRVFGRADSDKEDNGAYCTTTNLHIRTGPGGQYPTLAVSPLPTGIRLQVLAAQGEWKQVVTLEAVKGVASVRGWVNGRYLQLV
ncbi:MAG: N-acetylmuramyl-L-alanine amidase [Beggiatoa sp. IS2]|nr:MAG: N-acetylmuramyl-L-alanine amidase [Beggiatoa sp. IS2]